MSRPPASRTASAHPSRRAQPVQPSAKQAASTPRRRRTKHRQASRKINKVQSSQSTSPLLTPHRQKLLWAGGAITLLAMAMVLPTRVSSQAIADANCEQVITSGAEISRGQLSSLLEMPEEASKSTVRQMLNEPYCTLPAITPETTASGSPESKPEDSELSAIELSAITDSNVVTEREAYPLAFDPEAWVVLNYQAGQYVGYDFVFKP